MGSVSTARPLPPPEKALATYSTSWLEAATAVVCVHGELDAANSTEFIAYVSSLLPFTERLIVDFGSVGFFGTAAFSAVHTVSVRAAGHGVNWAMVPSRDATRLLGICDPDSALPARANLTAALSSVRHGPPGFPRLVTDNG